MDVEEFTSPTRKRGDHGDESEILTLARGAGINQREIMEQEPDRSQRSRENTLVIALVVLGGGIGLFFLDFITFGLVGSVLSIAGLFVVVGALHYLVWGYSLTKEVAPEREALRRKEQRDARPMTQAPADAIQDLGRTQGIQKK